MKFIKEMRSSPLENKKYRSNYRINRTWEQIIEEGSLAERIIKGNYFLLYDTALWIILMCVKDEIYVYLS